MGLNVAFNKLNRYSSIISTRNSKQIGRIAANLLVSTGYFTNYLNRNLWKMEWRRKDEKAMIGKR